MGALDTVELDPIPEEESSQCQCKICWENENTSNLLQGVCNCTGSLGSCHARCLVQWQLKRTSNLWICEICRSKIQWPQGETLQLVELLSELAEPTKAATPTAEARRRRRRQSPSHWLRLKQLMSRKCAVAARSMREATKLLGLGRASSAAAAAQD